MLSQVVRSKQKFDYQNLVYSLPTSTNFYMQKVQFTSTREPNFYDTTVLHVAEQIQVLKY